MKAGSDKEGLFKRGLTRRELLQTGAIAGLGAGLLGTSLGAAACGSGGDGGSSASPAASGSAGAVKPGGVFTLATDQMFPKDNLNPLTNTTDGIDALEGMLREGLVTYDFTFTPQPRLAESWEVNAEATEYTFKHPAQRDLARRHAVHGQGRQMVSRQRHVARTAGRA